MEYIVIVGSGEKTLAELSLTGWLGQQEIVIKAMQDYLGELPEISAAPCLGTAKYRLF